MSRTLFSKQRIKKLKEDIERKEPENIKIDLIDDPKFHDRTYIDPVALEELAENIKRYGLIEPIVVRKKEDGRFERIAGYRRLEAVKKLGWKEIPAIILDVDETTALALMLSENIHRENLSDFDRMYSVLQYLQIYLGLNEKEIKSFFQRWVNKKTDRVKSEYTEDEIKLMQEIEKVLSQFKIKSWRTFWEMMKLLTVDKRLKEIAKKYGLKYTIVIEVNKLRNKPEQMEKLIQDIVKYNLGYSEVKKRVREILGKENLSNPFSSISKKLSRKYYKLPENKRAKIDSLIKEIENLLND